MYWITTGKLSHECVQGETMGVDILTATLGVVAALLLVRVLEQNGDNAHEDRDKVWSSTE
jgi:hypothetical protein